MGRLFLAAALTTGLLPAVVLDRIDIRVDNSIIKDSDILRNLRVTDFLNGHPLNLDLAARREAGKRLIDQIFIREEIRVGDYPRADWPEADAELDKLRKDRFQTSEVFDRALSRYGITEADLRFEFRWQLTVLRFIDARFRPGVLVNDTDIESYFKVHHNQFKEPIDDVRDQIRETITGEKINEQFFAWLDGKRKTNKILFYQESLR